MPLLVVHFLNGNLVFFAQRRVSGIFKLVEHTDATEFSFNPHTLVTSHDW